MKRALALVLAVVLVMSLGITAFAADGTNGTITISNPTKEAEYKLYKIFDATYATTTDENGNEEVAKNENGEAIVAYTIKEENDALATLMFGEGVEGYDIVVGKNDDGTDIIEKAKATDFFTYDANTRVVTAKSGLDTAKMFKYLAELVKSDAVEVVASKTCNDNDVANGLAFTNLDSGYYVIVRTGDQANAVTITTAKPDATVIDKNQLPSKIEKNIVKIGGETNGVVSIGETIEWKLHFTATNYDGAEKILQYNITDTLTPADWAEIDLSTIKVTVDGENAEFIRTSADNYTGGFAITIPWFDNDGTPKYNATALVEITYSATVTDKAATPNQEALSNEAHMTWDTDTENNTPEGDGDKDVTDSKLYNLGFTKVDGADNSIKLENVKFELYRDAACNVAVNVTGSNGIYKVDPNSTSNEVVTPADGRVVIMGLEAGTYYLKETETLDGYNKLGAPKDVTVGENVVATYSYTVGEGEEATTVDYSLNGNATIENNKGIELPSTGGKGTMMLITFGTMVAVAFAVLMITQKKMSIYND